MTAIEAKNKSARRLLEINRKKESDDSSSDYMNSAGENGSITSHYTNDTQLKVSW